MSVTVMTDASSKYNGIEFTFEAASTTLDHFSGPSCPFRASPDATFASETILFELLFFGHFKREKCNRLFFLC